MGLSSDSIMGSDSVTQIIVPSNDKPPYLTNSWNNGRSNQHIGSVDGIKQVDKVISSDGIISAKWIRNSVTKVNDIVFDIIKNNYYIILAAGLIDDNDKLKYHLKKHVNSDTAVDLKFGSVTTPSPEPTQAPLPSLVEAYKKCSEGLRLCFGYSSDQKSGCLESKNCVALITSHSISSTNGTVEFDIYYNKQSTGAGGYVAIGLSTDASMGDDAVTLCISGHNGKQLLKQGWNVDNPKHTELVDDDPGLTFLYSSDSEGLLTCRWRRTAVFSVKGHEFDIKNKSYFLLLANGNTNNDDTIQAHRLRLPSAQAVNLQTIGILTAAPIHILIRLHGLFMIIGWICCVSIAILMARHYKSSWPDSTLCGVKIWFAFHRALMITGVIAIIISTILIFVKVKGWSGFQSHPIVGLTSIILAILQPIGSLFRPPPDSSKRWIFNYFHRSGGYIGHILAVTALCLTVKFEGLLPKQFLWVVIGFTVFYIFAHILHHLKTFFQTNFHLSKSKCED
ncbi:putative ferric-chelate reductase 1 homolog [Oppia nitens]|uniref:putative ferric-chelate reductase 1 homolog n=1 Tax=Oppia nitens TaxID=1686743 RepID=UPI0023DC3D87|nr:putative ferric-chelate reductase 1 homolog [Oppia nitens]